MRDFSGRVAIVTGAASGIVKWMSNTSSPE